MFQAIKEFLSCQGLKYMSPDKAGDLREEMLTLRLQGQQARKEFTDLAQQFQQLHPEWELHRTSQWMNQAQILRPHFWAYLQGIGSLSQPMLALRLYGDAEAFGVSLEVSFLERKKDEYSLAQQAKVLELPIQPPLYYLVQANGESQKEEGSEMVRQQLQEELAAGRVRKVLVKYDVPLSTASSMEAVLEELELAWKSLLPYYEQTRTLN